MLFPYIFVFTQIKFSTDSSFMTSSEVEGVQEVSPAPGHNKPVSVGCPLYNEASAIEG